MTPIVQAILDLYIESGKASTVKEIAARMRKSEVAIRKALDETTGCEVSRFRDAMVTYSTDYPGMEHGRALVWKYGPTPTLLRRVILAEREAVSSPEGTK